MLHHNLPITLSIQLDIHSCYHDNWTLDSYLENISSSILVSGLARVSILQLMSTEERSEILTCTVKSQAQGGSSQGPPVSWTEDRGWQTRILGAQTGSPNKSCHETHVSKCQFLNDWTTE